MALISCPECGKSVSDRALKCIHCGYDLQNKDEVNDNRSIRSSSGKASKRLVCEICEGTNLIKEDGAFICQGCGCRYSIEEAKKLMVDIQQDETESVPSNESPKLKNLYTLARRAKTDNNTDSALNYYEQIVIENPNDWEASFYCVYYKALDSSIANMTYSLNTLSNSLPSIYELLNALPEEKQQSAFMEVTQKVAEISDNYKTAAYNFWEKHKTVDGISDMSARMAAAIRLDIKNCDLLTKYFLDSFVGRGVILIRLNAELKVIKDLGEYCGLSSGEIDSVVDRANRISEMFDEMVNDMSEVLNDDSDE